MSKYTTDYNLVGNKCVSQTGMANTERVEHNSPGSNHTFSFIQILFVQVPHVIRIASEVMKMGKCVVIGLQSTGEARTLEAVEREEELTDFVSTAKGVLQVLYQGWPDFFSNGPNFIFYVDVNLRYFHT
jgi:hypothetical protein